MTNRAIAATKDTANGRDPIVLDSHMPERQRVPKPPGDVRPGHPGKPHEGGRGRQGLDRAPHARRKCLQPFRNLANRLVEVGRDIGGPGLDSDDVIPPGRRNTATRSAAVYGKDKGMERLVHDNTYIVPI